MKLRATSTSGASRGGVKYTRTAYVDDAGRTIHEQWALHGVGHAWSGGSAAGSYTDPRGPDASRAFLQFFLTHDLAAR
jgi:poly(3-hydroxybutyrate) depolymerase